jgi:hypothetical protein
MGGDRSLMYLVSSMSWERGKNEVKNEGISPRWSSLVRIFSPTLLGCGAFV